MEKKMENQNLIKIFKEYYGAKKKPSVFKAGKGIFITTIGRGEPGGEMFTDRVGLLYKTGYSIRARQKKKGNLFTVAKLEGFWWSDNDAQGEEFLAIPREEWNWKLIIRMPDFVTLDDIEEEIKVLASKGMEVPVSGEIIDQGQAAHILHLGPFSEETTTLKELDQFIDEQGLKKTGGHHEIYISDFRKVDESKLKTILMYEVGKK